MEEPDFIEKNQEYIDKKPDFRVNVNLLKRVVDAATEKKRKIELKNEKEKKVISNDEKLGLAENYRELI